MLGTTDSTTTASLTSKMRNKATYALHTNVCGHTPANSN